jgi:hypothetical protein
MKKTSRKHSKESSRAERGSPPAPVIIDQPDQPFHTRFTGTERVSPSIPPRPNAKLVQMHASTYTVELWHHRQPCPINAGVDVSIDFRPGQSRYGHRPTRIIAKPDASPLSIMRAWAAFRCHESESHFMHLEPWSLSLVWDDDTLDVAGWPMRLILVENDATFSAAYPMAADHDFASRTMTLKTAPSAPKFGRDTLAHLEHIGLAINSAWQHRQVMALRAVSEFSPRIVDGIAREPILCTEDELRGEVKDAYRRAEEAIEAEQKSLATAAA